MSWIVQYLWLIPVLPAVAAGCIALMPRPARAWSAGLAIGSMGGALLLAVLAFGHVLSRSGAHEPVREVFNFEWFRFGTTALHLGWVLDPLSAVMVVMVCFVGLLIFIYSVGYMAQDDNFTRFFCFLALFAGAMLGVVIANSLLLLFICWELVGLTSYLLIGFWFQRPAAAAAAKKAFITTRVGDLAFLLGIVWLYGESGTLLFYGAGQGCLEPTPLGALALRTTSLGLAVSTAIGLLIFVGAIGKSGQVPLHVWLPDAMEGPTPVSALIHAATMVAAGVFLVARVFPLMALTTGGDQAGGYPVMPVTTALTAVTWIGAITALFAASIAVAQTDIKRILAYSTVSQLGFMMMGLGAGGVAVGMFHLITHAFFKALLFMGAGSVIHGCHEEQDIRRMGGLRQFMPVTFATYAVGMMALSGVPLLFSGFWSKDGILHALQAWPGSKLPFLVGTAAAFLTAFYMTRQVVLVFYGNHRGSSNGHRAPGAGAPHESPRVMTVPLGILAVCAVVLGFVGTPAWPWFQSFLGDGHLEFSPGHLFQPGVLGLMAISSVVVLGAIWAGVRVYAGRRSAEDVDPLERRWPSLFRLLANKYFIDELYARTLVRLTNWLAAASAWVDETLWSGVVRGLALVAIGFSWLSRLADECILNRGFDESCGKLVQGGGRFSRLQQGRIQPYLRVIAVGFVVLGLILVWGWRVL